MNALSTARVPIWLPALASIVLCSSVSAPAATLGYWRFEEGPANAFVYNNPTHYTADSSGNGHHANSYSLANSASYSTSLPLAVVPQTGAANNFSLYTGPGGTTRDVYTTSSINNASLSSFTIEISVQFDGLGSWQTFVGRDANFSPLAALYFQLSQDAGLVNHVAFKVMDAGSVFRQVFTRAPVVTGRWYHFVGVGDSAAHTLTLLSLDPNTGLYEVENSTSWNGPMASTGGAWTLGRGMYNGAVVDPLNGLIDEARISDAALATNQLLWYWASSPAVVITTQPTNTAVNELSSATFAVGVSGQPPFTYQWFRDDVAIPGATNPVYMLPSVQVTDQGAQFKVTVRNITTGVTNSATSSNATLSVITDSTPPTLAGASWLGDPRAVVVLFSEPVQPASALAATNYFITSGVSVVAASPGADARSVVLTTTPLSPSVAHTLTVNHVRDQSSAGNSIAPDSQISFTPASTPLYLNGTVALLRPAAEPLGPSSRRSPFAISEIHYHPPARGDGRNAEFIEIFNSQPWPEDVSGFRISGSVDFTFPSNTIIAARGFLVVAAAPVDVQAIYGLSGVLGPWTPTNNLPNDAGTVRLRNRLDGVLLEVNYTDEPPWPAAPDGSGHSLVLARPSLGERDPRAWDASQVPGGTPGTNEVAVPPVGGLGAVVLNELLAHPANGGLDFVELFNYSTQVVDLAGCVLTDDPVTQKFVFPSNSLINPLGFVALDQAQLGFGLKAGGDTLWLKGPDGARVLDVVRFGAQQQGSALGRFPDGASAFSRLDSATPATPNARPRISDVVLNEIMFHPISGDSDDEYVELLNRSTNAVNLAGWELRGGINFVIPSNTVLAAGSQLVIGRNAARLRDNYPHLNPANTLGNFSGKLADGGDDLRLTQPSPSVSTNTGVPVTNLIHVVVDELSYHDGGRWSRWADGGGSSLELTDPRADKRLAPAWADSDESARNGWTTIETTGVMDNGNWSADSLQILLPGPGEILVDDVEVIPQGGANLVANPGFESGFTGWFCQGAHATSFWETTQGHASSRSLHIVATDRGDPGANRVRTALTSTLNAGQTVTLRAKVKWLRGPREVLLRLRGNWLEAFGDTLTTTALGTPGEPNSRAMANAGPAITEVAHLPVAPANNQTVTVVVRVSDPDPLAAVTLNYRVDPSTNWTAAPMQPRGAGWFSAEIPGQAAGALAAFFITASDAGAPSASSRFPAQPARECLVRWGDPVQGGALGTYRLWMTAATFNTWSSREKLSNDPLDCTFVYGDFRVIYNAGGQYSGSAFHSPSFDTPTGHWCNYQLIMPGDDLFLGTTDLRLVFPGNEADDDTAQREQTTFWLCESLRLPFNYNRYVHYFVNGVRRGSIMEDAQRPDPEFLDEFFPGAGGELFRVAMWQEFDDAASGHLDVPATIQNFTTTGGAKKLARYRWIFQQRAGTSTYAGYTNLLTLVDAANAPLNNVVSILDPLADTDNWMRMFAFEHAIGNWDSWGNGNGQNLYLFRPDNGRWLLLPYDTDIALGIPYCDGPTTDLFKSTDAVLGSLNAVPSYRRAYWRALLELAEGPFLPANVNTRLDPRYAALTSNGATVNNPQNIKDYMANRRAYILSQAAAVASPFLVFGPTNFSSAINLVTLTGVAPVNLSALQVNGVAQTVTWTSVSNWTMRLLLQPGAQSYVVQGVDGHGTVVPGATATLAIDFSGTAEPPEGRVVFSEIMFAPLVADAEYVEIFNSSTNTAFDLSGWRVNGADYTFLPGAFLMPRSFLVLAKDPAAFTSAYGTSVAAFDSFAGNLQADGETLTLTRPGLTPGTELVVARVTYAGTDPWPPGARAGGAALQLIDPAQDISRVCNWSDNTPQWRFFNFTANSGSVSRFSKFSLYFDNGGDVLLDEMALVTGSVPGAGTNFLKNGDFESALAPLWTATSLATNSAITNSAAHSGTNSLRLVLLPGSPSANYFFQYMTNVIPSGLPASTSCTLSFWYRTGGSGTLVANINAGFRPTLPLGASSASAARFTPGASNSVASTLPALPRLYLSEVQPVNTGGERDNFNEAEPWIEIHNAGSNAVSLAGCWLANQFTNLQQWAFPTGAVIGAGEYLLIWADGQTNQTAGSNWHTSFRPSPTNGALALTVVVSNTVLLLDYFVLGGVPPEQSFGSYPPAQTSYRQEFFYVTPRATNNPASPPVPLFINEWMAENGGFLRDPADNDAEDWFELFNPNPTPVDLTGWFLTDNGANLRQFVVPVGHVIAPGGWLLVWADNEPAQNTTNSADLHVNFKLSKDGEFIALSAPDGTLVDWVVFGPQTNNLSQGRAPDGSSNQVFLATPTPRGANPFTPAAPDFTGIGVDGTNLLLTFTTVPGLRYQVFVKGQLGDPVWTPLGDVITATGAELTVTNAPGTNTQQFYRMGTAP